MDWKIKFRLSTQNQPYHSARFRLYDGKINACDMLFADMRPNTGHIKTTLIPTKNESRASHQHTKKHKGNVVVWKMESLSAADYRVWFSNRSRYCKGARVFIKQLAIFLFWQALYARFIFEITRNRKESPKTFLARASVNCVIVYKTQYA